MPNRDFGPWLKAQLKAKGGWSQGELARRMGRDRSLVSNWARGVNLPTRTSCAEIARALELPVEEVERAAGYEPEGTDARTPTFEEVRRMVQEMQPLTQQLLQLSAAYGIRDVREVEPVTVPILGYVPADSLRWTADDDLGFLDVTPGEIRGTHDPFAVIVRGDCLRALTIVDGDTVILDNQPGREPIDGDLVAVEIDGEVTLKRWCETDEGIELRDGEDNVVHRVDSNSRIQIQGFYVTFRPTGSR